MNVPSETPAIRVGDRYRLDERIGAGAMGAVWRATDELLNRTVAVKELLAAAAPPTAAGGDALEESRQRILREGRIGARLRHAHVISMFDVVVHDDRPWLVMEYLPSRSLAGVLAESGLLADVAAADIGRQVADGLAAAHSAGVVHRDVKPGNVLISDEGLVKLTDFGVSRAVDEVQLTRTGLIAGTPAFLAPEVARGHEPTSASDVFALGATLYAAVEGRPPFGLDDNAYALLHKVATGAVTPPRRAGRLTPVIMWLLGPEPGDRPTAIEARDVLEKVAAGRDADLPARPVAAVPPAPAGEASTVVADLSVRPAPTVPARADGPVAGGPDAGVAAGAGSAGAAGLAGLGAGRSGSDEYGPGSPEPGAAGPGGSGPAGSGRRSSGAGGAGSEPGDRDPGAGGFPAGGSVAGAPSSRTAADVPGPEADRTSSRRRGPLLVAALVVLALVGGITGVVLTRSTDPAPSVPPAAAAPSASGATAAPTTVDRPAPTTSAAATTPPPTTTTAPPPPPAAPAGATDPVTFVQNYYALLPGNTEAAFALLSSSAQAVSGGRGGYDSFYGGLQSVSVQNLRATGAATAEATVVFVRRDGRTSSEPYRFVMTTGPDGRTIMESFSRA